MASKPVVLSVAKHFSATPGPRRVSEGRHSADEFLEFFLTPFYCLAVAEDAKLVVNLDGTAGYSTGFLEGAFGGMVRKDRFNFQDIKDRLELVSTEVPEYADEVSGYMEDAAAARSKVEVERFMEENGLGPEDMVDNLTYPPAE